MKKSLKAEKVRTKKDTNFTPGEIKKYLGKFQKSILDKNYIISKNQKRKENISFIEDYNINSRKEKEILLGLDYDDFCYAIDNEKEEFAHEKLYVFCKNHDLDYWGSLENVDIYIKINMTKTNKGEDITIIVSLHK